MDVVITNISTLAYVNGINIVPGMFSTYVGAYIRNMFRPVRTIRTIEPRQLATLKFRMIVEIVLVSEGTRTIWALELSLVRSLLLAGIDRVILTPTRRNRRRRRRLLFIIYAW